MNVYEIITAAFILGRTSESANNRAEDTRSDVAQVA